ncbi:MAG: GNAT family N-acetyltransferase [bacterium]
MMEIRTSDVDRRHRRELTVGGEPVSWLEVVDFHMRIGSASVKMGGIAGVETKKEHRNRGYARAVISDTLSYMKDRGYVVSMLFGIPDFYPKFGYASVLPETRVSVATRDAEEASAYVCESGGYKVRPFSEEDDVDEVISIYSENNRERSCTIVRTNEWWRGFKKGSEPWRGDAEAFVLEGDSGDILGYFVVDKWKYSANVAEIGARSGDAFGAILGEVARIAIDRRVETITFFIPPDHPFVEFCRRFGCEVRCRYPKNGGGMMRIIDQDKLFSGILEELGNRLRGKNLGSGVRMLEIDTDLGRTVLRMDGSNLEIVEPDERLENRLELLQSSLVSLVVGYRSVRDVLRDPSARAFGDAVPLAEAIFPTGNPYVWVTDHF